MGGLTPLPLPPGSSDPNTQNAVPDVNRSTKEKVLGGIGGVLAGGTRQDFNTTPLAQQLARSHQTRLANARRNYENAASLAGALSMGEIDPNTGQPTGINPETQQPMTPEERAHYDQMKEGAWGDYAKAAGVDPDAKKKLEQHKGLLDFATQKGHAAFQQLIGAHQQAGQAAGKPPSSLPTPPPSPTDIPAAAPAGGAGTPTGGGAAAGAASSASSGGPPPLPSPGAANPQPAAGGASAQPASPGTQTSGYDKDAQLAMPMFRSNLAAYTKTHQDLMASPEGPMAVANRKNIADNILHMTPGTRDYEQYIAHNTFPLVRGIQPKTAIGPNGEITAAGYDPTSNTLVGPDNQPLPEGFRIATAAEIGQANIPKPISYKGPKGEKLPGWRLGTTRYSVDMKPLPEGTEEFVERQAPTTTVTEGVRMVKQNDGSTVAVPVTTTTERNGGQATGGASVSTPSKLPPPPKAGAGTGGRVVGGTVPKQVEKAEEDYNSAVTRQQVMEKSLPEALAGNQQAMINVVANHLGMTAGIQKGSRINQALWTEAMTSAPMLQNIVAKFGHTDQKTGDFVFDGPLDGVHIPPEALKQMVALAGDRVTAQKDQWDREVAAAQGGYGMNAPSKKKGITPPPSTTPERPKGVPADAQWDPQRRVWFK